MLPTAWTALCELVSLELAAVATVIDQAGVDLYNELPKMNIVSGRGEPRSARTSTWRRVEVCS